eukprot:3769072-Prymnesium_polylepis.1
MVDAGIARQQLWAGSRDSQGDVASRAAVVGGHHVGAARTFGAAPSRSAYDGNNTPSAGWGRPGECPQRPKNSGFMAGVNQPG